MLLEGIQNIQQQHDLDCLVACCKQVLGCLGIDQSERWLWRELQTSTGQATSFDHVVRLENSLGLVVELHKNIDNIQLFAPYIESGLPVLVAVDGDDPTEWPYYGAHAVVVIGFDDQNVYVNDPAQETTGLAIDVDNFLLAWGYKDYEFAVIRLV